MENKLDGTIIWNLTLGCNMDCPYCLEGHDKPAHPEKELLLGTLDNLLESISGTWELRLNGGEVFDIPYFMDEFMPRLLNKSKHKFALLTNLTYPEKTIEIIEASGDRLNFLSSSMHLVSRKQGEQELTFIDPQRYLANAKKLRAALDEYSPETKYFVNCVLLPSQLEKIRDCKESFAAAGIPLFFQHLKTGVSPELKAFPYNDKHKKLISEIVGDEEKVNPAESFLGCECRAGSEYFIITEKGEAFPCHAAIGNGYLSMGSLTEGPIELFDNPLICPYVLCTTSVPKIRGVVNKEEK